jgi:malate synthase
MTTSDRILVAGLQVARALYDTVETQIVPDTGFTSEHVWTSLASAVRELGAENVKLLKKRDRLQSQIDAWHAQHPVFDLAAYKAHLKQIGYLEDAPRECFKLPHRLSLSFARWNTMIFGSFDRSRRVAHLLC